MIMRINPQGNGACPICRKNGRCPIQNALRASVEELPGSRQGELQLAIYVCPQFSEAH